MGLPSHEKFADWFGNKVYETEVKPLKSNPKPLKNVEVPILDAYTGDPGKDFWKHIPFTPLPKPGALFTPINVDKLEELFSATEQFMSSARRHSVLQTINDLRYGADSMVDFSKIYPLHLENAKNMQDPKIGAFYTDQLVTMLKKGFVSGPFANPLLKICASTNCLLWNNPTSIGQY